MFDNLRQDIQRLRAIKSKPYPFMVLESLLLENGFQAVVLFRMAHWFKSRRIPLLGPLLGRLSILLCGVEIAPGAKIGPGLLISHGMGIVVGQWATIGSGCTMMHQVTLGAPATAKLDQMPTVGDDVFLAAGCRLIGDIQVGDGSFIGANAVVAQDVPAGAKVVVPKPEIRPPR
ncbi:MAG: serine O-acetyltransferase [Thermoanaerobaculia bacterium]|nr:serine O-acetyltransferase [Thermoanaerobaculia bacterium]